MPASVDDADNEEKDEGAPAGDGNDEPNVEVAEAGGRRGWALGGVGRAWEVGGGRRCCGAAGRRGEL